MPAPSIHGFAEKVALIINGSEGVGRAVAMQLALQGCFVICSYEKSSDVNKSALNELQSLGTLASSFEFTDAKTLIDEVDNLFGRLDLLVNCLKYDEDSAFQIDIITKESLRLMQLRPKGLIVNVISEKQAVHFVDNLPQHFRQNCVVTKTKQEVIEHQLFVTNNNDDIARVILFFLSNESKALNRQVLYCD
ncbi:MAG TPA: SDR family NAD(P)-dependent oxidoreductase [Pyrinomonadaceae bacterium]|nr:SDR family NAD(P)-dependent oxidoreductase [Pyrinomonadaceae bacterium]